jgi:hypothetical protein
MNARLWPEGEPLAVVCDAHGRPQSFRWAGHTYQVERICNRWRAGEAWWQAGAAPGEGPIGGPMSGPIGGPMSGREYIKLATNEGLLCLLARDLRRDVWLLVRVYD